MIASPDTTRRTILVITELYPNVTNSFIGTFVVRQLLQLRHRYNIVVLTSHFVPLSQRLWLRPKTRRNENGLTIYSFSGYPLWLYALRLLRLRDDMQTAKMRKQWLSKKIAGYARKLDRHYHFSIVHGHEIFFGDEAGPVGRLLKIPSIFTLHGLFDYHRQGLGNETMDMITKNIGQTDELIAVSKLAASSYAKQTPTVKPFTTIPNGIDLPLNPPAPDKRIINFAAGKSVLLGVGFFVHEKRFDQLIRLLAALKVEGLECVLVLVGRGPDENSLRIECQRSSLESQTLFLGEVQPSDMPAVYTACDIVVHPSVVDSFSMVCLEAMSFGRPVVCTANIGITEYTSADHDILVIPPDDESALHDKVLWLLNHATERAQIGSAAKRTALTMTADKIADQVARIYERLQ